MRRFRGWEPTTTHRVTEWTEDGRPAAWTTDVEPEFDANERDSWYALDELEAATCPHCGGLQSICSDPDGLSGEGYYPQRQVCWVSAVGQVARRRFADRHDRAKPDEAGFLPDDGLMIWASFTDDSPDDDFLGPPERP